MKRLSSTAFVFGVVFACGDGRDGFDPNDRASFDDIDGGATPSTSCEGAVRCSRDLHAVVDACDDTRVITECAPDQGCANGTCVPACAAAVGANGSTGCEFVALPPPHFYYTAGSCFAAFVANTWGAPARIEGDYGGEPIDVTGAVRKVRTEGANVSYESFDGEIQPGEVAVVFLSHQPESAGALPCPVGVTPAVRFDTALAGTSRGRTFRIRTTAPVSAYSIYPFGGAEAAVSSATLLLPLSSWKTDYVVTNPWKFQVGRDDLGQVIHEYFPTTQIVAAQDDTTVTVIGSAAIAAGVDVEGAAAGAPKTYRLQRGEQLHFAQDAELTGTRIGADKPIGVWSGHTCMKVPADCCCDAAQMELFPLKAWGRHYAVVPYISRASDEIPEQYMYRITGAVEGTVLTYEPSRPKNAPVTVRAGESVTFDSTTPFVVKSQDADHPFAVFAYMTGFQYAQAQLRDGDPEFTTIIPTEQYLGRYVFFVDPSYANSQLVVVRSRDEKNELQPVVLDCAGPLEGWTPIGDSGQHEYVRIRMTKNGVPQPIGTGTCSAGRHEIDSRGQFAVTVWGTNRASSYAYPGGAALRTINDVDNIVW